jgi:hypothetical protein
MVNPWTRRVSRILDTLPAHGATTSLDDPDLLVQLDRRFA